MWPLAVLTVSFSYLLHMGHGFKKRIVDKERAFAVLLNKTLTKGGISENFDGLSQRI